MRSVTNQSLLPSGLRVLGRNKCAEFSLFWLWVLGEKPIIIIIIIMRLQNGQVLEFTTAFKYLGSFVQNDVSQDKELNRRIGLATMTFGKLKSMVFFLCFCFFLVPVYDRGRYGIYS